MSHAIWHWTGVVVYSLVMLALGLATRKRMRREEKHPGLEFWMARRQLPGWMLAVSLTSGWLMLGWIGFGMSQIYQYGATALWILNIPWFILCIIVIAIVPLVRRIPSVSVPQAIGMRFGPKARLIVALCSIFVFVAWTQAELFMGGRLVAPFLNVPRWVCIIVLVSPVLVYMTLGGFRVVILTDQIQFAIMAIFMMVLAGAAVMSARGHAPAGDVMAALRQTAPPLSAAGHVYDLWFLGFLFPIVLLVGYLPGWLLEQDLALRIQAAPTTREAYKGAIIGWALITIFVLGLPTVIAACAMVAYPPVNGKIAEAIGSDGLGIVSAFIQGMPLWLAIFMVQGIIACQMSTVDTFANVSALAMGYDVLEPMMKKRGATPHQRVRMSQWVTIFILLLSMVSAIYSESLNDVYYISSGVLSASVALPAIFIYWKRTTSAAAVMAAIVGVIGTVGGYWFEYKFLQAADDKAAHYYTTVLPGWLQNSYGYNYVAGGVVLSLIVLVGVSLLTPQPTQKQLAEVRDKPVDEFAEFAVAAES